MSCLPGLTRKLSKKELKLANSQKLKFSSPAPRESLVARLAVMADSPNRFIRARAASDYQLPNIVAASLQNDENWFVRATLARNENISTRYIEFLAHDVHETVRGFAILNERCTWDTVEEAARFDSSHMVRQLAEWKLLTRERAGN